MDIPVINYYLANIFAYGTISSLNRMKVMIHFISILPSWKERQIERIHVCFCFVVWFTEVFSGAQVVNCGLTVKLSFSVLKNCSVVFLSCLRDPNNKCIFFNPLNL